LACHLQIDVDPNPDPAYHFDADPDPDYRFDSDPDPTFHLMRNPDLDPQHCSPDTLNGLDVVFLIYHIFTQNKETSAS
jgi:hypothetical protein